MDYLDIVDPKRIGGTIFSVQRNGEKISEFLAKKINQCGKTIIDCIDTPDVLVGDDVFEESTHALYKVIDIIRQEDPAKYFLTNHYKFFHLYVENKDERKPQRTTITATNSVININSSINAPITISSLQQQIEGCSPEDKAIGYELIAILKEIQQSKKPIKRNALQKFGDFLAKYSPIAIGIGQILVQVLAQH